jgi:Ankyrin repeats (3 copies)
MSDGDSRPPTRPASPSIIVHETHSLPRILSPLHRATEGDDIRKVIELLAAGANVNEKATDGKTPLHVCAQANNTVMAEELLDKSASMKVVDHAGREPLRTALDSGSAEMACMLLSRGAPLDALSDFILDMAQRDYAEHEKELIKRCVTCVASEGTDDQLMGLLLVSAQGAPPASQDTLVQLLRNTEWRSEMSRLVNLFQNRIVKTPITGSGRGKGVDDELDTTCQTGSLKAGEAGGSEHEPEGETLAKRKKSHTRPPESVDAETSETKVTQGIVRGGASARTTLMRTTGSYRNQTIPGRWIRAKQIEDERNGRGNNGGHSQPSPLSKESEPSGGLALDTRDLMDAAEPRPPSNELETDDEVTSELKGPENGSWQSLYHKHFSWEIAGSDVAALGFAAQQEADSDQGEELYLTSPPSTRHVLRVSLQELCERQQLLVPQIVLDCISILERSASEVPWLYQYPSYPSHFEKLKDFIEAGELI